MIAVASGGAWSCCFVESRTPVKAAIMAKRSVAELHNNRFPGPAGSPF